MIFGGIYKLLDQWAIAGTNTPLIAVI